MLKLKQYKQFFNSLKSYIYYKHLADKLQLSRYGYRKIYIYIFSHIINGVLDFTPFSPSSSPLPVWTPVVKQLCYVFHRKWSFFPTPGLLDWPYSSLCQWNFSRHDARRSLQMTRFLAFLLSPWVGCAPAGTLSHEKNDRHVEVSQTQPCQSQSAALQN